MASVSIQQAMELAGRAYQGGNRAEAEKICRQILAAQPNHPDALHLLSYLARDARRLDVAEQLVQRAAGVNPNSVDTQNTWAAILIELGKLEPALAVLKRALELLPASVEANNNLAIVLLRLGRFEEALEPCRRAMAARPDFVDAHFNLASALWGKGDIEGAISAYRSTLVLRPVFPEANNNLGVALLKAGRLDEAIEAHKLAVAQRPKFVEAYHGLANALMKKGKLEEAIVASSRVVELNPNLAEGHNTLGLILHRLGRAEEALAEVRRAIELRPSLPEAHMNLSEVLRRSGRLDEAISAVRHAISLRPSYACAHSLLALTLLLNGEFVEGWREYEWRWQCEDFVSPRRNFSAPLWDGSDLGGRRILIHAEQGLGDSIQFIRYVSLAAQRGGRIVLECPPSLKRMIKGLSGIETVEELLAYGQPLPQFDVQCPLLSFPKIAGTTVETIPADVPYLTATADDIAHWKNRLSGDQSRLKVGLVWASGSLLRGGDNRSALLPLFSCLGREDATFYSLQKGPGALAAKEPPAGMRFIDGTEELYDFADTAALVANLDLVITVDAVAHLAGAMGKPVWVLLPKACDARWMLNRDDSPWYPTMRLFRQSRHGAWEEPLEVVGGELQKLAATSGPSGD